MNRWAAASFVLCACGSICPNDADIQRAVTAGAYVPAPTQTECTGTQIAPVNPKPDEELTISADRTTVTETYVRDGKSYRVVYDVTAITTP